MPQDLAARPSKKPLSSPCNPCFLSRLGAAVPSKVRDGCFHWSASSAPTTFTVTAMSEKRAEFSNGKDVTAVEVSTNNGDSDLSALRHADDALLAELGYKSEFRREFSVSLVSPARLRTV